MTLVLDDEDVTRTLGSMLNPVGERAKFIEWPNAVYSMHQYDDVKVDGETIGVSTWVCYSANEGKLLTLGGPRHRARRAGHRGDLRLGRGGRRHGQAHRGAPRADRDASGGHPGPDRRRRAQRPTRPGGWRAARA